jgi:hypothetical protein
LAFRVFPTTARKCEDGTRKIVSFFSLLMGLNDNSSIELQEIIPDNNI